MDPEHIATIQALAASKSLGQLIGKTKQNYNLGYYSFTKLFHNTVIPVMEYSIGAWNIGTPCTKLDQIQNRAAWYFLGIPKSSPIQGLIGEIGWIPGLVRRDLESIRFYNEIMKQKKNALLFRTYMSDKMKGFKNSWSQNIRAICKVLGKVDCWENDKIIDMKFAKLKLLENYEGSWHLSMLTKPKLTNYSFIKSKIEVSSYVKCNVEKSKRSLICQLLCGNLPLQIETGRYQNLERKHRICELCRLETESEMHFLFRCPQLNSIRIKLYHQIPDCLKYNEMYRLQYLLEKPNIFSNFVNNLWHERLFLLSEYLNRM